MLDEATIAKAPKALLHDHLDGGLRPATVIDLAAEHGYEGLPTTDVDELATWFRRGADRKSLELYLETFDHTFGVMQWPDAIARVAAECAEDLAADGVVYAEVRMAPELCTERGPDARRGGRRDARGLPDRLGPGGRGGQPDRHEAARHRDAPGRPLGRGRRMRRPLARRRASSASTSPVPRQATGRPATSTRSSTSAARTSTSRSTPASRSGCRRSGRRSSSCGAERLGHGVRIVDDITVRDDGSVELGRLAAFVRDRRVPLEMCPSSNVHTGAAPSIAEHPIDLLRRLRYRVTLNTDNRLMSGVSLSSEFAALDDAFGIGLGEMEWLTINAMKSAFAPFDERLRIINEVVKPGYARLRAEEARVVIG